MSTLPAGHRRALRAVQVIAALAVLAYAAQAATGASGGAVSIWLEDWLYPLPIALAAVLCAARAASVRGERTAWAAMAAGLALWAAAEVVWTLVIDPLPEPPALTVSDVLWFSFYPWALVALGSLARARVRRPSAGVLLDAAVGALGLSAVGAALVFGTLVRGGSADPDVPAEMLLFFEDLVLLGVAVAVLALTGWRPGRTLGMVAGALAAVAAVDTFFLWADASGAELSTTLPAALWPAAAVALGAAAWQRGGERRVEAAVEGWRTVALPSAFAVVALGVVVAHALTPVNGLAVGLAAATLAAVIGRMALTLGEHMRLLAASRDEALTDALTALGNRRKLVRDLDRAIELASAEGGDPRSLLLFDLDGFKQYNDFHGHPAGDALLQRLGRRLAAVAASRPDAEPYRLGGDEFCVIVRGGEAETNAVLAAATEALHEREEGFEVFGSCGHVAIPEDATTAASALQLADERLYAQKARRRRFSVGRQTSNVLLQALEEREPDLRDHLNGVADTARAVGLRLGLREEALEQVVRAAELHDVGKVAVPDAILQKPGPLDDGEWTHMREHTIVGDRILSAAAGMEDVAKLVRASHERFDGRGYPDGLAGEAIPLGARIVTVCDAFHAMTSQRPYRPAVSSEEALGELRRCAGRQFDPVVVAAFGSVVAAMTAGADELAAWTPAPPSPEHAARG